MKKIVNMGLSSENFYISRSYQLSSSLFLVCEMPLCCRSDNFTTNMATSIDISSAGVLLGLSKCRASTCHISCCKGLNLAAACRLFNSHRGKYVVAIGAAVLLSHSCSIGATNMLHGSVLRATMLLSGVVDR